MIPFTVEETKRYHKQKTCHIYKKVQIIMIKNIIKAEIIVITLENKETLLIMFVI